MTSHTLAVPGARLYYEARGAGPTLLLIPGGPADAGGFAGLAAALAARYTVVAYDPRDNSRSTADAPHDLDMAVYADDAAAVISAVGNGPAYVFGSSGGGQIGLALAARHPARLRAVLAHEPPCIELLPDAAEQRAFFDRVVETFHARGVAPAIAMFMQGAGLAAPSPPAGPGAMTPELAAVLGRMAKNFAFFLPHGLKPISLFVPDVAALRAGSVSIAIGVGAESAGQLAHRTALALAAQLGVTPVRFPGDHAGYGPHAAAFADALHRALV